MDDFEERNRKHIAAMGADTAMWAQTRKWFEAASRHEYSYHFKWMGLPIIQYPQDVLAIQEIIWSVQPMAIVETGIARGGSLVFLASMLELLGGDRIVVGVDVDIRSHNRKAIEAHPMARRISMLEGSSTDRTVAARVREMVGPRKPVLVILDSNHSHDHVLEELRLYSSFVSKGSYLAVLDTVIEDMPESFSEARPWGPGNNARTAVNEFLQNQARFEVDESIHNKLLITVAPGGYLKCVRDQ
jgi:cephalosporin hydroxylase